VQAYGLMGFFAIPSADPSSAVSNDSATTGGNFLVFLRQLEGIYLHLLS
jgi:hypothetical protein